MKKEMVFYGLVDFYATKEKIKLMYEKLNIDEKEIYKMYVYSLPFMEDNIKDLLWEYINNFEESQFDLAREYRKAKEKLEKRKKNAIYYSDEIEQLE